MRMVLCMAHPNADRARVVPAAGEIYSAFLPLSGHGISHDPARNYSAGAKVNTLGGQHGTGKRVWRYGIGFTEFKDLRLGNEVQASLCISAWSARRPSNRGPGH